MKKLTLALLSLLAIGACGGDDGGKGGSGGSGLPGSLLLKDITPAQSTQLCHYAADVFPAHDVTCSGETQTIGVDDAMECVDSNPLTVSATCTATVDNAEACFDALGNLSDADLCALTSLPAACAWESACGDGGSAATGDIQNQIQWLHNLRTRI